MVIGRMPEDLSKPSKNIEKQLETFEAIYTCMCTPVGSTADNHNCYCFLSDLPLGDRGGRFMTSSASPDLLYAP
eukprot:3528592-Heterocapsa_arctica.AAC.1